jgi:phosphatidylglycerophosphate synthase
MRTTGTQVPEQTSRGTGDGEGYRQLVDRLASAQKTNKGAPAYSRYVNRPLGRRFAALAQLAGRTPNQVTALSAVCSLAGIALLALVPPSAALGVAVAALLVAGYALDAADGQLARLQGSGSRSGEFLDHVVDAVKLSSLHAAVLIGLFRFTDLPATALLVPLGFQVVAAVWFFAMILVDQMRRAAGAPVSRTAPASPLRSLAAIPTDYGVLCLTFLLYGFTGAFLAVYGVLFAGSLLILGAALLSWYREISRRPSAHPTTFDAALV